MGVSEPGSAAPDYRADNPTLLRCQSLLVEETFDPDTRQMTVRTFETFSG